MEIDKYCGKKLCDYVYLKCYFYTNHIKKFAF